MVKVIYHATQRHYLEVQWLDLARSGVQETIENTVDPKEFGINLAPFRPSAPGTRGTCFAAVADEELLIQRGQIKRRQASLMARMSCR